MSSVRLYVDEDAAENAVVQGLRERGIDVLTVVEANRESQDDKEQLEFAVEEERAIYSLNVADFCRLHQEFLANNERHFGIIVIPRQRYSVGEKLRRMTALLESVSAEDMQNRLEFL